MNLIFAILAIVFFAFVLNIIILQSNNFIFMVFRKPLLWICFMGLLSFLHFFIGSLFKNSFNIIWSSALLGFIPNIPPKVSKKEGLDQKQTNKLFDEMYLELGIRNGRLKYRIGLLAYVFGGILGWFLFYGRIVATHYNQP